jgi:hypothetical protein
MNMKLIYSLIFIICFSSYNLAQCILANDLDSPDWGNRINALETMAEEEMVDCIPEIHQRIFNQPSMILRYFFLRGLAELNDPDIEYWALAFIDSADNFEDPLESANSLQYKVDATKILFDVGNYSTVQYVFDLLNEDLDRVHITALVLLNEIILNVPAYAVSAESELVRILNNYEIGSMIRIRALNFLDERNYSNIIDECLNAVLNDPVPSIRHAANAILRRRNYDVHSLYLQQLFIETDPVIRSKYATVLLHYFGEPLDLKAVIDFYPSETDTTMHWFVGYEIDNFIPPKPASLNWQGMITRLVSYTSEMFTYGWITHAKTRDYYISTLNLLNSQLERRLYTEACATLNIKLLERIEADLAANKITTEGYKFLHYYCVYIKEEFPGPLPCL